MEANYMMAASAIDRYNVAHPDAIQVRFGELMARHTTFHIGGPADLYLEPRDEEALRFFLTYAREAGIRTIVIGRGSNLLFADAGFRGAVIATSSMRTLAVSGSALYAGAGVPLSACAHTAMENALTGMEFAYGIPGSCGGAVYMNAGAYDGEMAGIVTSSRYYDADSDKFGELDTAAHEFGYRTSVYRHFPRRVILSVSLTLSHGDREEVRAKMEELMRRRREKQPLTFPSAGSTFKRYPGRYTAQMIDEAGLRGYSIGGAQVSEKHAGFIINRADATADDVLRLIEHIRNTLQKQFGVSVEPEVIYVPET